MTEAESGAASKRARQKARRQERLEAQNELVRAQRRRRLVVTAVVTVIAVAGVVYLISAAARGDRQQEAALAGVTTYSDLSRDHVTTSVEYEQTPPVGGAHAAIWQNCGFYPEPIDNENALHSMEHGAVWIAFDPSLPQPDIDRLKSLAGDYVLVSPYEGLTAPVVASAWGVQLPLDGAADARLDAFIERYREGSQTPEPGAVCTDGVGDPA